MNSHEARNNITEYKNSYALVNLPLLSCYNALPSEILPKTCHTIFEGIIGNKINVKKHIEQENNAETRRIYNRKRINPDDIVGEIKPSKAQDEKLLKREVGNLSKILQKIHDQNIFYIWRVGHPFTYMYFIERDPAVWTHYNPSATIPPKTIKKLAKIAPHAVKTMSILLKKSGKDISLVKIRRSYADFLEELISKMADHCREKVPHSKDFKSFSTYIEAVETSLKNVDDFEGLRIDPSFVLNLPESFRIKYLEEIEKLETSGEKKMPLSVLERKELEAALIPKNKNLVVDTIGQKAKTRKPRTLNAKKKTFAVNLNPFQNSNHMVRYYQATFRQKHPDAIFDTFDTERIYATKLIDRLTTNGRSNDKKFLKNWILYYAEKQTTGRSRSTDVTSIKSFSKTFTEYQDKYLG